MWWNNLEFRKTQTLKQTHVVWTYSFPKTKIWSLTAFPRHMELSLVKWNGGVELLGPKCVQYYQYQKNRWFIFTYVGRDQRSDPISCAVAEEESWLFFSPFWSILVSSPECAPVVPPQQPPGLRPCDRCHSTPPLFLCSPALIFHPKASLTQTRMDLTSHTFVLKTLLIFSEFL